jgi:ATP-dependent protease Clp ATPase subunit
MPLNANLRRGRVVPGELLSCSFCGKHQKQIKVLITGADARICNDCIDRVHQLLASAGDTASAPMATIAEVSDADGMQQCSFCGKRRHWVAAMAATGSAQICNECIELCDEVVSGDLG